MSTHKTPNLSLHAWEESDRFDRTEINENFAAIDAAVGANAAALDDAGDVLTALADADAALSDRVTAAQSTATAAQTAAGKAQSTATAAQTAANTAQSTATAAQSAAATAQSTADVALAAANAAAEGRGNVKLVWGTYTGTGTCGKSNPSSLTFPSKPLWVTIHSDQKGNAVDGISVYYGAKFMGATSNGTSAPNYITWSGNTMRWYTTENNANEQFNASGETYTYIALLAQ